MNILNARKLLGKKIIGITCHNSLNLLKLLSKMEQTILLLEHFSQQKQKKVKYKANIRILKNLKYQKIFQL